MTREKGLAGPQTPKGERPRRMRPAHGRRGGGGGVKHTDSLPPCLPLFEKRDDRNDRNDRDDRDGREGGDEGTRGRAQGRKSPAGDGGALGGGREVGGGYLREAERMLGEAATAATRSSEGRWSSLRVQQAALAPSKTRFCISSMLMPASRRSRSTEAMTPTLL